MKYIVYIKDKKFCDKVEVVFNFSNINYERIGETKYEITYEGNDNIREYLNSFDYMACIQII